MDSAVGGSRHHTLPTTSHVNGAAAAASGARRRAEKKNVTPEMLCRSGRVGFCDDNPCPPKRPRALAKLATPAKAGGSVPLGAQTL